MASVAKLGQRRIRNKSYYSITMKSHSFLLHLPIFFLLFLSLAYAHKNNNQDSALHNGFKGYFSKVYAFGDSYTDTGNAHLLGGLNSSANGKKSTSNSTKSGEPGSRLCDGRLVVDFLCEALSLPPLPPYKSASFNFSHGVNFAIAGSTSISSDYFIKGKMETLIWNRTPINFDTQIDWFKKLQLEIGCKAQNDSGCRAEMENTLYWVGATGVNDYSRAIGSSVSLRWLAERSVTHVSRLLKIMLDGGAKYIVVEGLPPLGCLPVGISRCPSQDRDQMGCASATNIAIMIHNQILQRRMHKIQKMYPSCSILYADYWNAYLTILMNPEKYQIQESFKACCGTGGGELNFKIQSLCGSPGTSTCNDPSKHISWDGIHLTEAMNLHLVDLFLNQGFCQPTFKELIKSKSGI